MIDEKIQALQAQLDEKRDAYNDLVDEIRSAEDLDAAKEKGTAAEALQEEIRSLENDIAEYENLRNVGKIEVKGGKKVMPKHSEYRDALNDYLHSKGEKRDGVDFVEGEAVIPGDMLRAEGEADGITSPDVAATIPQSIQYNPELEIKTVSNLKNFVTGFKATTASGKYPILKKATAKLASVAELAKNPKLAEPEFTEVSWEVVTYRGALPISRESIDDSAIDLVGLVARHANEQKVNTTNAAIATVLKSFDAKTATSIDDLKTIVNVDLDVAYNKVIVCSQTFYNEVDLLKDGNGRYLLQDSIISPSGKVLLGMVVHVVEDDLLGVAGDAKAFIGDLARGVLFADRLDISVRWLDHNVFGQYLQVATRFDVKKADEKAGFFVTFTPPTTP